MGGEASGQSRQVKHILVLFAICRPVPRSERFSSLFPPLRQNQLAQNRLVGACGAPGQPAVPPLLACYVLPGMSPTARGCDVAMLFLGSSYPQPPRIGYRVPAFVSLNASLEARYPTIPRSEMPSISHRRRGRSVSQGIGLGVVPYHSTWRSLLLPAGLACMATAAYGARRNGVASTRSDNRGRIGQILRCPKDRYRSLTSASIEEATSAGADGSG